jgi:hypothetical protein
MIRLSKMPDDQDDESNTGRESATTGDATTPRRRKPRGVPAPAATSAGNMSFYNPAQVAELWGISHDKVLEFIRTGELAAFDVASKKSRRPQFKIPLAALQAFQERRSGRDPARCLPPPPARRSPRRASSSTPRDYF